MVQPQTLWKIICLFLKKKLSLEFPSDAAVLLLVTYAKDGVLTDNRTPTFIAALFAIARRRKQPKRPSVDEWTNEMWCTRTQATR